MMADLLSLKRFLKKPGFRVGAGAKREKAAQSAAYI